MVKIIKVNRFCLFLYLFKYCWLIFYIVQEYSDEDVKRDMPVVLASKAHVRVSVVSQESESIMMMKVKKLLMIVIVGKIVKMKAERKIVQHIISYKGSTKLKSDKEN